MENLFPQEGLLSVIILLKSSIIPVTFMVSSWLPSYHVRAGEGFPLINKPQPVPLLTINPHTPPCSSPVTSAG